MTPRQRAIHERVRAVKSEIVDTAKHELSDKPIGYSVLFRLPIQFQPFRGNALAFMHITEPCIQVFNDGRGLAYRDHDPVFYNRKGRTEPRARLLASWS